MPTLILSPRYSEDSIKLRRAAVLVRLDMARPPDPRRPERLQVDLLAVDAPEPPAGFLVSGLAG